MKLITLNTHSLAEPDWEKKLELFAELVFRERPDVIALQEVNQTRSSMIAEGAEETGFLPCPPAFGEMNGGKERSTRVTGEKKGFLECAGEGQTCSLPVRRDNYALLLARRLKERGCPYHWTWAPAKLGYDIYEEGLALLSLAPVRKAAQCYISQGRDFSNWKTRKLVGIQVGESWYYSVHMGWWGDEEEPFASQWDRALSWMREEGLKGQACPEAGICPEEDISREEAPGPSVWVMGDFNSPAGKPGEGWDYVKASGFWDTYELAEKKDGGVTAAGRIDGWEDSDGRRIDYIWCSPKVKIESSQVICNGSESPVVSDHYGVMIVTGGMV